MTCDDCPEHSGHEARILDNKESFDKHDIEFKDVKLDFAKALKSKVDWRVFVLLLAGYSSILGIHWATLSKASETLSEIDKKVAVLYDRETEKIKQEVNNLAFKDRSGKANLVLALTGG